MRKISILLAFIFILAMPLTAFADSGSLSKEVIKLNAKYTGYDLSNINEVSKVYSDDVEFQKLY